MKCDTLHRTQYGSAGKRNQAKQHSNGNTFGRRASVAQSVCTALDCFVVIVHTSAETSSAAFLVCHSAAQRRDTLFGLASTINRAARYPEQAMTRRRWIADTWTDSTASLLGEQAVHLARVLRAEPGQSFDVLANGFLHRATVTSVSNKEVIFALHEELEAEAALPVHLLLAIIKFDHYEWGLEKATELGAARITPVLARRTDKHLAQAAAKRLERWRKIAREAAQQSRRSDVPEIDAPQPLRAAVSLVNAQTKLLLAETEQTNTLAAALQTADDARSKELAFAVGPEGGWAAEEMQLFTDSGFRHVTLGPRILRAETAALCALSICSAFL